MERVIELYDTWIAAKKTLAALAECPASPQTLAELRGFIGATQSELKETLRDLPEAEREGVLVSLSEAYGEDVRKDVTA